MTNFSLNLVSKALTFEHSLNCTRQPMNSFHLPIVVFAGILLLRFTPPPPTPAAACICDRMTDSLALVDLYNSADGANWSDPWNLADPIDTWKGIGVDANFCITRLLLTSRGLSGTIPTSIGSMEALDTLTLTNNDLSGNLPASIWTLGQLTILRLGSNALNITLPNTIDNLTNLEVLNLSNNNLSGGIPAEMTNLSALNTLDLSNTGVGGTLPAQMDDLSNLVILKLQGCSLTGGIPAEVFDLTAVEDLWLFDNQLTGTIPSNIGNLLAVQDLRLSFNQLTGPIPASIGSLSTLETLILSSNNLTGNIPPGLSMLTNLGLLRLNNNNLDGNFPDISGMTTLFELLLQENNLSGPIPDNFNALTALKTMVIHDNNLSGNLPGTLQFCTSLEGLNAKSNQFSGPIPAGLGNTSLIVLDLTDNQLTGGIPAELGNLAELEVIKAANNQLDGQIHPDIKNLSKLELLFLENNQLTGEIPPNIGDMDSLRSINVAFNQLTGSIPASIVNCDSLTILSVQLNNLTGPIPTDIGQLSRLTSFTANSNQLSGPIPESIGNLGNLSQLLLNDNQLSGSIPATIGNCTLLFGVSLADNNLTGEIPASMGNLSFLNSLSIRNNGLTGGIPSSFGNLDNLKSLFAEQNQLSGALPEELGGMASIELLWLQGNDLSDTIPSTLGQLNSLLELRLNANELSGPIPSSLGGLSNLTGLYLHSQFLNGPIPPELGNLSKIEELNLNGNELSGEIPASLGELPNLQLLGLGANLLEGCIPSTFFDLCTVTVGLDRNPNLLDGSNFSTFCSSGQGSCLSNFECADAALLPMNQDPCSRQIRVVKLDSATTSSQGPVLTCNTSYVGNDAWFQATVPSTLNFLIKNDSVSTAAVAIEAYTGSCSGGLTAVACAELDSLPFVMALNGKELGFNEGQPIYFRVWDQGNTVVAGPGEAVVGLSAHELAADSTEWELCDFATSVFNDTTIQGSGNRIATQFILQFDSDATTTGIDSIAEDLSTDATLADECLCLNRPLQLWLTDDPIALENLRKKGKVSKSKSQVDTSNYNYLLERRTIIGNSSSEAQQNRSRVGIDGSGQLHLIWQDFGRDGSRYGVFGRSFDFSGAATGPETQLNTTTLYDQELADLAVNEAGDYVAVWMTGINLKSIRGQVFQSDGTPVGNEFKTSGGNVGSEPSVTIDSSGLFAAAWETPDSSGFGIDAQLFQKDGDPLNERITVVDSAGAQANPAIALNDAGNLVIAWDSRPTDTTDTNIWANLYERNDTATIFQRQIAVNNTTAADQQNPEVTVGPNGRFVITWESEGQDGDGSGIYAQRFDSLGNPLGSEIAVNTTTMGDQSNPAIAGYPDGSFIIAWESVTGASGVDIFAQIFTPEGQKAGTEVAVNTDTQGNQVQPDIALNAGGQIVISWTSYGSDEFEQGIYAQRFTTSGQGASRDISPVLDASQASGAGTPVPYASTPYAPANATDTVTVTIFDTGIDADHPNLVNGLWNNPEANDTDNCLTGDVIGYDFVNQDGDPDDVDGHGASVSGMVVGDFPTDVQLELMSIKFYEAARGSVFDAVCGIYYAVQEGAKVLNLSWGFEAQEFPQILFDALRYASERDVLIINSAGNTGKDNDAIPKYPGNFDLPNLIVVAASQTDADGNNPKLADYSSFGATTVDLAAPGFVETTNFDGTLTNQQGTSFAAPAVARTAAILRAKYPCLTAAQIKDCILTTVDPYSSFAGKTVAGGILDHDAALACAATKSCLLLAVKVNLQGAYDAVAGKMRADLSQARLVPNLSPFSGADSTTTGVLVPATAIAQGDEIVDWVTVQLRSETDSTIVQAEQSALLQRDGDVVDLDGESPVRFHDVVPGNYFVAIRNRNHLGVMTERAISLSATSP